MTRPPTLTDWMRDPACIDRYLASLDTLPLTGMGEGTLGMMSEFLFEAARAKVQSAIILTAPSITSAPGANRQQLGTERQVFLGQATMFETAGRCFCGEVRIRERARTREAGGHLPNT